MLCTRFKSLTVWRATEPVIAWYYNNQVIKPSKYFLMASGPGGVHTLQIAGAFPEDEGAYKCVARNQAGEVTCIAHLKVLGKSELSSALAREAGRILSTQPTATGIFSGFCVLVVVLWMCQ